MLLTFLRHPRIDATNWRAEQALRPFVVVRKVWGGNRTEHGASQQEGTNRLRPAQGGRGPEAGPGDQEKVDPRLGTIKKIEQVEPGRLHVPFRMAAGGAVKA